MFWIAVMVMAIIGVTIPGVVQIVKISTRHYENVMRIKHGYPTLEGDKPKALRDAETKDAGYIDMTGDDRPGAN